MRLLEEVVRPVEACDHCVQGGGHINVGVGGDVGLAFGRPEIMHLGLEGVLYLTGAAAELNDALVLAD